jgi:hypothetical protein
VRGARQPQVAARPHDAHTCGPLHGLELHLVERTQEALPLVRARPALPALVQRRAVPAVAVHRHVRVERAQPMRTGHQRTEQRLVCAHGWEPGRTARAQLRRVGSRRGPRQIQRAPPDGLELLGAVVVIEPHHIQLLRQRGQAHGQARLTQRDVVEGLHAAEVGRAQTVPHGHQAAREQMLLEGRPVQVQAQRFTRLEALGRVDVHDAAVGATVCLCGGRKRAVAGLHEGAEPRARVRMEVLAIGPVAEVVARLVVDLHPLHRAVRADPWCQLSGDRVEPAPHFGEIGLAGVRGHREHARREVQHDRVAARRARLALRVQQHPLRNAEVRELGVDVRAGPHDGAQSQRVREVQEGPHVLAAVQLAEVVPPGLDLVHRPRDVRLHRRESKVHQTPQGGLPVPTREPPVVDGAGAGRQLRGTRGRHLAVRVGPWRARHNAPIVLAWCVGEAWDPPANSLKGAGNETRPLLASSLRARIERGSVAHPSAHVIRESGGFAHGM